MPKIAESAPYVVDFQTVRAVIGKGRCCTIVDNMFKSIDEPSERAPLMA